MRIRGPLLVVSALLAGGGTAQAATFTFLPTGSEQTFQVPPGVTSVHAVAVGGRGGQGGTEGPGGFGALAIGDLPVTPGEILYIEVGGNGKAAADGGDGGFNGGGNGGLIAARGAGGGGASDIRTAPRVAGTSLTLRLIVAAGGGGGGGGDSGSSDTNEGGTAGAVPTAGSGFIGATPGQPGSATAGGAAGHGCLAGIPGSLGLGGRGADELLDPGNCGNPGTGGGGGGGGVYGGGGGGGSSTGAGGGAGWSGFGPGATNTSITTDSTGGPSISITPIPGGGGPTAPPPPAKPKLQRATKVRVGSDRRFSFSFTATAGLKGSALERSTKSFRVRGKRRKLTLAKKSFTVPASGKVKLKLRLSASNFALLKRRGKLGSRMAITLRNTANRTSSATKTITLLAPKRR